MTLRNREFAKRAGWRHVALAASAAAAIGLSFTSSSPAADATATSASATFKQYCFQCHGKAAQMAGMNLESLTAQASVGDSFQHWTKVAEALETHRMPPKGMPQPPEEQRQAAVNWIRAELNAYAKKHDGDPGRVTVRRLTSGEYAYSIYDLTHAEIENTGIDASSDSVGGEGFTNFGDVQFMQDQNLERYLEAAKRVADHAVIGAGPLEFFDDPGKTGFELSAISRIREIYAKYGFRTVSGEGGRPFGLERYGKAIYANWWYDHRAAMGEPNVTLKELAAREGITPEFAQHMSSVIHKPSLGFPSSEVVARYFKLPAPTADRKASAEAARTASVELQKYLTTWPSWLFARGDVAAGGAGDESPLEFSDRTLSAEAKHRFIFIRGGRGGGGGGGRGFAIPSGPGKVYVNVTALNPKATGKPVMIWRNPTVGVRPVGAPGRGPGQPPAGGQTPPAQTPAAAKPPVQPQAGGQVAAAQAAGAGAGARRGGLPPGPRVPLRTVVSAETAKRLNFGVAPDGSQMGPDDFASEGTFNFEVVVPEGNTFDLQMDADLGADRDQVFRVMLSDREDGAGRGAPNRALIGDMSSAGYKLFRSGVMEFATILPPNSHGEPTPADKDPVPDPFDNTYNVPEHDEFVIKVKYIRDDRFVVENLIDKATRARLDNAWNDLYASFEYHDAYLRLLAKHYKIDYKEKTVATLTPADMASWPAELQQYAKPVFAEYKAVRAAQATGRPGHVNDALAFASKAWRRPLAEKEKASLRAFYDKTITTEQDHVKAMKALIARILVSPAFLYRVEQPPVIAAASTAPTSVAPFSNWEMASRLSYFLWASIPDEELRRAAAANELSDSAQLQKQVKRMLADPKSRRFSTEFFGQWLGFYHFDESKGVDTTRFPEFTPEVKRGMYDEAVTFFDHIVRKQRPVREILSANYTFANKPLAKFYGFTKEVKSEDQVEMVEGADAFHRGGLMRLGAVLTATSAPLRTSPVKRGDWILRRIVGTPVPPPPADAGSIPADDKLFGGLSLREKLEAHKRNATCANCHLRIDPLGFSLEHYDSTGRWREKYADGKAIEDFGTLSDQTKIEGVNGLLNYLNSKDGQVRRTLAYKLVGYALGRTVQASDQILIDRMVAAGGDATIMQLASEIVTSKQFRNRLREAAPAAKTTKVAATAAPKNTNQGVAR